MCQCGRDIKLHQTRSLGSGWTVWLQTGLTRCLIGSSLNKCLFVFVYLRPPFFLFQMFSHSSHPSCAENSSLIILLFSSVTSPCFAVLRVGALSLQPHLDQFYSDSCLSFNLCLCSNCSFLLKNPHICSPE